MISFSPKPLFPFGNHFQAFSTHAKGAPIEIR